MATVPMLRNDLLHLERSDTEAIVLDLRELTFFDGSALHAFLSAHDHAEMNGYLLVLVGVGEKARRLFEITGTEFLLDERQAADLIGRFNGESEIHNHDEIVAAR